MSASEPRAPGTGAIRTSTCRARFDTVARPLDHLVLHGADGAPALLLRSGVLTYADLRARVATLAGWLRRQVPHAGARVASWAAKGELTCLMPLAAARAGLVHVPVNPLLKPAQVAHILADSGASLLIATAARLASLAPHEFPPACRQASEDEALAHAERLGEALPPSRADPDDLAALLYTSGSTGRPKGVMLSHANMWLGAHSVAGYLGLGPDDRTLAVLPLSFDYGQNQLLSSWYAGAAVAPLDYLTPGDVLKAVERERITTLAAVPPLWVQLAELDWPRRTAARLRRLTNSGGALTPKLVQRLRTLFPQAELFAMYGLTEAFRSTYLDPALIGIHPRSMGRAVPMAEILVIADDGQVTADGEEGELVHCGPLVAHGYWNDPQRTAERFRPAPPQSDYGGIAVWSGDRVRRDADGLLYFAGRRDGLIKSSGNRISPEEIEEEALATGLVAEAVALGVPDERLGQAIHLVVRAAPGAPDAEAELPRILGQRLPNFMKPKAIHWRLAMPVGPNGKIDRHRLKQECEGMPGGDARRAPPHQAQSGELRARLAEILGVAAIGDDDTFIALGGDSLNYVQASILLESMPGEIPEDWENLPFSELQDRLLAKGADQDGALAKDAARRRAHWLEPSVVLRAIAILLVVLSHTLNGKADTFAGATDVLLLIVGVNFARFQLSLLEIGGSRKVMRSTFRRAIVPYFTVLTLYFIYLKQIFWPEYLLYSNFTAGVFWDGDRRFKTYWFLEVYITFILLVCLLYLLPQVRAFSRRRPKALPIALFNVGVVLALVARPYSDRGIFYEETLFSALPVLMFGWLLEKLKTPAEKCALLVAGIASACLLPLDREPLALPLLVIAVPALMFVRRVPVDPVLAGLLSTVAGASFYIYLLHGIVLHGLRAVIGTDGQIPILLMPLAYVAAVVTGLFAAQALQQLNTARLAVLSRSRPWRDRWRWPRLTPAASPDTLL